MEIVLIVLLITGATTCTVKLKLVHDPVQEFVLHESQGQGLVGSVDDIIFNKPHHDYAYRLDLVLTAESLGLTPPSTPAVEYKTNTQKWKFGRVKWCGAGTDARGYDDLGSAPRTDACCREHDHCHIKIKGDSITVLEKNVKRKNGEASCVNYGIASRKYTLSHCSCDDEFRKCLTDIIIADSDEDKTARLVGATFFNVLKMQCIEEDPRKNNLYVTRSNAAFVVETNGSHVGAMTNFVLNLKRFVSGRIKSTSKNLPECPNSCLTIQNIKACSSFDRAEYKRIEDGGSGGFESIETSSGIIRRTFLTREDLVHIKFCHESIKPEDILRTQACGVQLQGEPKYVVSFME